MKSEVEQLTFEGIRAMTGASPATVSRWVAKGCPHIRQPSGHGGRPILLFPKEDALSWIASHGNMTAARKAIALAGKSPGEGANIQAVDLAEIDAEGLLPCLARLRKTERATYRLLSRLKEKGDVGGATVLSERYVAETRALSALEAAAVQYRTRTGELGPRREMQGVFEKVIVGIKNAVLGIPSNVIPQLIPFLRDPEQAHEVHAIIDRASRDALRAVANKPRPILEGMPSV